MGVGCAYLIPLQILFICSVPSKDLGLLSTGSQRTKSCGLEEMPLVDFRHVLLCVRPTDVRCVCQGEEVYCFIMIPAFSNAFYHLLFH